MWHAGCITYPAYDMLVVNIQNTWHSGCITYSVYGMLVALLYIWHAGCITYWSIWLGGGMLVVVLCISMACWLYHRLSIYGTLVVIQTLNMACWLWICKDVSYTLKWHQNGFIYVLTQYPTSVLLVWLDMILSCCLNHTTSLRLYGNTIKYKTNNVTFHDQAIVTTSGY